MRIAHFAFEPLLPDAPFVDGVHADPVAVVDILPPPPSFNEAELEAAKLAAHEEGFMAGKAEGKREIDHEMMQLQQASAGVLDIVRSRLDDLSQQHQQYLIAKQADLGRLVLSCAERLAVEALRKEPLADIEAMVRDCLGLMMGKPEVAVQVNPKLHQSLAKKFGSQIKITSDPDMNPVDCRISWSYGEATREIDKIWSQIEETIDRYFAISATEMSQQAAAQSATTAESLTETSTQSLPEGENHG